jgi:hypothetical protein
MPHALTLDPTAAILNPLADAGDGIFTLSSFDTDYPFVKAENAARAADAPAGPARPYLGPGDAGGPLTHRVLTTMPITDIMYS